jgi:hypothetical protein
LLGRSHQPDKKTLFPDGSEKANSIANPKVMPILIYGKLKNFFARRY